MAKNKDSASYGIIGLGRFGTALAKSLAAAGKDVMIIDSSEAKTPSSYVSVKKSTPASSPRSMS